MDSLGFRYTDLCSEAPVVLSDPTPLANAAPGDAAMVERKDKPWTVYRATCLVSKKSYIGVTSTTEDVRWSAHLRDVRRCRRDSAFHQAIRKYGVEAFVRTVLYVCVNWREAIAVERGLIAQYGTLTPNGYNISIGGEAHIGSAFKDRAISETHKDHLRRLAAGMKGRKRKQESVEKGRVSQIGHRGYFKGRKHTPEAIEKIRVAASEKWRDEEIAKARSRARTPEQKERIRAGLSEFYKDQEKRRARAEKVCASKEASGYSHSEAMKLKYRDDPTLRVARSEQFRALWVDHEIRAKMLKGRSRSKIESPD